MAMNRIRFRLMSPRDTDETTYYRCRGNPAVSNQGVTKMKDDTNSNQSQAEQEQQGSSDNANTENQGNSETGSGEGQAAQSDTQ